MTTSELLTSVVGSHARPSWFVAGSPPRERGEFGPADLAEMLDDAVDLALRDQEDAGIDVGQRRRDAPGGLLHRRVLPAPDGSRPLPPDRRLGAGGHDQQHRFEVLEPIAAPDGLGVVAEYRYARDAREAAAQGHDPGPVHAVRAVSRTGRARSTATGTPRPRHSCPSCAPSSRGSSPPARRFIQIDEPSPAIHPDAPRDFVGAVQRGGRAGRRAGPDRRAPVLRELPRVGRSPGGPTGRCSTRCSGSTSTSSSSSSPTARWPRSTILGEIAAAGRDVAAGVIDVKNYTSSRPTRSPSGSRRCSPPASRPSAYARPRLRVQPDRPLGDARQAPCPGRRPRPRARSRP